MPTSWRKVENEKGFPYYINEANDMKQWDHPKFGDIKQRIDDCNYIKYATYRVASKIRVLQHALYTEDISLNVVAGVFEKHRLGATESSLCLENYDVEAVLSDIYFASNKQNHTNVDIDFATELMINFLYNVFDKDRTGKVQVSSTKLVLAILSNSKLSEIYRFIFNLCADHNNCVTRLRLQSILSKLAEITTYMHEDVNFGQHLVNHAIDECFSNSPGLVGINENTFISWLDTSPQILSWLPALSRIRSSESVVHASKCAVCKTSPLIGLRYRCTKCSRYIQCQRCFLTGRLSHSHKLSHSMREFCAESNSKENPIALLKKLCGLLRCSSAINETYYTHEAETRSVNYDRNMVIKCTSKVESDNVEPLASPYAQLQMIIRQLELQNSELRHMLLVGNRNDKQLKRYLEEHRVHVDNQILKLKALKDNLKVPQPPVKPPSKINAVESTPMVPNGRVLHRNPEMDVFSPICVDNSQHQFNNTVIDSSHDLSSAPYSIRDLSTWMGGNPQANSSEILLSEASGADGKKSFGKYSPVRAMHTDLDEALAKLQQILANNFTLDESLGNIDNGQLKHAVTEVEGMLTSLIDTVENSRASSVQPTSLTFEPETDPQQDILA